MFSHSPNRSPSLSLTVTPTGCASSLSEAHDYATQDHREGATLCCPKNTFGIYQSLTVLDLNPEEIWTTLPSFWLLHPWIYCFRSACHLTCALRCKSDTNRPGGSCRRLFSDCCVSSQQDSPSGVWICSGPPTTSPFARATQPS